MAHRHLCRSVTIRALELWLRRGLTSFCICQHLVLGVVFYGGVAACTERKTASSVVSDGSVRTEPLPLPAIAPQERSALTPLGQWSDVKYDAHHFTTDKGAIRSQSINQSAYRYTLIGKTMIVDINLQALSIAGNPTEIRIAIPAGHTAGSSTTGGAAMVYTKGAWAVSRYYANQNYPYIAVLPQLNGGIYDNCKRCTYIHFTAAFEVN